MSKRGLYVALKENSLRIDTLERIAKALEVPVTIFFSDESNNLDIGELNIEIENLKLKNKDLETRIYNNENLSKMRQSIIRLIYIHLKSLYNNQKGMTNEQIWEIVQLIDDNEYYEMKENEKTKTI